MKHGAALALFAVAGLLASPAHAATPVGEITGCMTGTCDQTVRVRLGPTTVRSSLFVAIVGLDSSGRPDLSRAGWFDGHVWKVGGMPVAAWSGTLDRPRTATVAIAGGVCGLAAANGAPAGTYAVIVGMGRMAVDAGGLDEADIEARIRQSPPEVAAQYRRTLADYRAAKARLAQYGAGDSATFTDMRTAQTYTVIQQYQCGGK